MLKYMMEFKINPAEAFDRFPMQYPSTETASSLSDYHGVLDKPFLKLLSTRCSRFGGGGESKDISFICPNISGCGQDSFRFCLINIHSVQLIGYGAPTKFQHEI